MENRIRIEVIDKGSGLRSEKELNLQKRFLYIGSDPKCDLVLGANEEKGVTPKHLQVILDTSGPQLRCRAINLTGTPIQVSDAEQQSLDKLSAMDIGGEESLSVGAFDLVFHLGDSPTRPAFTRPVPTPVQTVPGEPTIRLRIELPRNPLTPENPLNGRVYITNLSSRRDVQVSLKLEGLPPDKYRIGQAPLLYPGAEQSVGLQLEHPASPAILPGPQKITISAEFGEVDAKETVSATQEIQVAPFYKHSVRLIRAK